MPQSPRRASAPRLRQRGTLEPLRATQSNSELCLLLSSLFVVYDMYTIMMVTARGYRPRMWRANDWRRNHGNRGLCGPLLVKRSRLL